MRHLHIVLMATLLLSCQIVSGKPNIGTSNQRTITIGMVGKIASNPVFQAEYSGARVAANKLGLLYNVTIVIDWQTPDVDNAIEQAAIVEKFVKNKVDGIAIACSDANYLGPVINNAVRKGVPVLCFDSDAPKSNRFAFYGPDDLEFGRSIMRELAREMDGKGTIAILAGSPTAFNQQRKLKGVKEELVKHPGISLLKNGVFQCAEIPNIAVETVVRAQKANPNITGWALIGTWPLQLENSLPWEPGTVKAVAGNAVAAELEYVRSGHVQALIGVNCGQIGYESIRILVEKILKNQSPPSPCTYTPLTRVSKKELNEWYLNWKKWLLKELNN